MKIAKQLTQREVDSLRSPGSYAVGGVSGLYINIQTEGSKPAYILRFQDPIRKKRTSYTIGTAQTLTLKAARSAALDVRRLIEQGKSPKAVKEQSLSESRQAALMQRTFNEVAEEWLSSRENSGYYDRNRMGSLVHRLAVKKHLMPTLGQMLIADITPEHLADTLATSWRGSRSVFVQLKTILSGIFRFSMARHYIKSSPCDFSGALLALLSETALRSTYKRNRGALQVGEIQEFVQDVLSFGTLRSKALLLAILTASRAANVIEMRWDEIDLERAVWVIPADKMKTKQSAHTVMLSTQAIEILRDIKERQDPPREIVFYSALRSGPHSHTLMTDMIESINSRRRYAGLPPWIDKDQSESLNRPIKITQHGVSRATFKTWTKTGDNWKRFNADAVELCLNHKIDDKYDGAYDRTKWENERREIMQAWADFLFRKENS